MAKNRKSLISIAASLAVSSVVLSASYLPLTSIAHNDQWVMFGVSKLVGSSGGATGEFSVAANNNYIWTDVAESYLVASEANTPATPSWGTLKVVSGTSDVEVRVDLSSLPATPDATDPLRTMYVTTASGLAPVFAFTYRASMEATGGGLDLEYKIGSGSVYKVTINSDNTYDNPAVGTLTSGGSGSTVALDTLYDATQSVTTNSQILDYNLTNNPATLGNYNDAVYGDDDNGTGEYTRIFQYTDGVWDTFDSRFSTSVNDFSTLTPGRGYWGKMKLGSNERAGLVLDETSLTGSTINTAVGGLKTPGWNLISFGNTNTEIRNSATGMLVDLNDTTGGFYIYDSSLTLSVEVNTTTGDSNATIAKALNLAVEQAKARGELPRTLDIKAFPDVNSTVALAIISNKKFGIKDSASDNLRGATSLFADGTLWSDSDNALATVTDVNSSTILASKYGEYMLMIDPIGIANAGTVNTNVTPKMELKVKLNQTAPYSHLVDINTSLAATVSNLTDANTTAMKIDVDQDGTAEYILIASDEPFYVRDNTFTRVYKLTSGTGGYKVTGYATTSSATATVTDPVVGTSLASAVSDINNTTIGSGKLAAYGVTESTTDKVIIFANQSGGKSLALQQYKNGTNDDDIFDTTTASSNFAKGSVDYVWNPAEFAKAGITGTITLNATNFNPSTDADSNVTIKYSTINGNVIVGSEINNNTGTGVASFSDLQTAITNQLADLNISATVGGTTPNITLTGSDLINVNVDINTTGTYSVAGDGNVTTDVGAIASPTSVASLTSDLKYNSIYTPNYVANGPLYTLNAAGYKLEALVTGFTDITAGTVAWESIDLTRSPAQWLASQDYNLFQVDNDAGYWAYVNTKATNSMAVSTTPSISYITYFNSDGTSTNYIKGTLTSTVSGVATPPLESGQTTADDTVRVFATLGTDGKKIEMTKGSNGSYTATADALEIGSAIVGGTDSTIDLTTTIVDGLGNTATESTTIDNLKPATPTQVNTTFVNELNVTSTSSDVANYYLFQDLVPETYSSGDELATATNGAFTNVCANSAAVSWNSTAGSLKAIAVDGVYQSTGNASDILSIAYMPIAKSRVVLTNSGTTTYATGGIDYNSTCEAVATYTTNKFGVQVASKNSGTQVEVKVAFPKIVNNSGFGASSTLVLFITDGTNLVELTYPEEYANNSKAGFISIDGVVYGFEFQTQSNITTNSYGDGSLTNAYNVSSYKKTGVKF